MENIIFRAEALLRFLALVSAVLAGCLVALDKQTKKVFLSLQRTATYKDLRALEVVVIIEAVVATYQFVQLVKCLIFAKPGAITSWCKLCSHWVCFLLDQVRGETGVSGWHITIIPDA
ncbi:CASP-like protein 2C1 isoform X2 [Aristolochia californica]|uniref:CASP-like protein 2C1 isoform X2 n=1 Tax=Aristolochia californica TaxID=171875 RepID=UPI0035DB72BD